MRPLSGVSTWFSLTRRVLADPEAGQRADVRVLDLAQHAAAGGDDPAGLALPQQQDGPLGRDDELERVREVAIRPHREHAGHGGEPPLDVGGAERDEAACRARGRAPPAPAACRSGEPPATFTSRSANIERLAREHVGADREPEQREADRERARRRQIAAVAADRRGRARRRAGRAAVRAVALRGGATRPSSLRPGRSPTAAAARADRGSAPRARARSRTRRRRAAAPRPSARPRRRTSRRRRSR